MEATTNISECLPVNFTYVAVKASLYASDSSVFGLDEVETKALVKKFSNYQKPVINGILLKAAPMEVVNALSQLGYRVVATTGEAEIVWTMQREGHLVCSSAWRLRGVQKHLKRGDVDQRHTGYTALHYAARNGHLDVCKLLIENGANIDAVTNGGVTALSRAASTGNKDIVEYLLGKGANPFVEDSDGKTALHKASENGHVHICRILLSVAEKLKDIEDNRGNKANVESLLL